MLVRSAVGTAALLVAYVPLVAGSHALRRRLLPEWSGPPGWLVQFVLVFSATVTVILGLGIVGVFSLLPTTVLLAACGVAMVLGARHVRARTGVPPAVTPERLGRPATIMAVIAVSFVAANWSARAFVALNHGIISHDSLLYHLPLAARYAQLHSITEIHHDFSNLSGFYPIRGELIHGLGMVVLGNDFLSVFINIGWGVVALLAAWCIGRPFGMGAVCTGGVAVLLSAPGFVATQAGSGHVDIMGMAMLLAVPALLLTANSSKLTSGWAVLLLAALLVGSAVGTKWTFAPVSAALTLGVILLLPRGERMRRSALWIGIVSLFGCFSYVRNLVQADSPLPPVDLTIAGIGWERQAPETAGVASLGCLVTTASGASGWNRA